jgi:uncharacterized integral membrane protein
MARHREVIVQEREGQRSEPAVPVGPPRRDRATVVKVIVGLVVLILFIVFVAQNSQPVTVNLVFGDTRIRLIWVFLACALIGGVIVYLLGRPGRRASRKYIRELERRLEEGRKRD